MERIRLDPLEEITGQTEEWERKMMSRPWWGYIHKEGTHHVKPYMSPLDIQEANESPFSKFVHGPFIASSRDGALVELHRAHFEYIRAKDEVSPKFVELINKMLNE